MKSKYTPGPWFTHREGFSTVYIEARIGGSTLQEVSACGPTAGGPMQQEANANLIAAAPELLEALELAHEHMKIWIPMYRDSQNVHDYIIGAIAKAKGETND